MKTVNRFVRIGFALTVLVACWIVPCVKGAGAVPYALSRNNYPSSAYMAGVVVAECGPGTKVADWKDVAASYGSSDIAVRSFCDAVGLASYGNSAWILLNGHNLNGGLHHFFVERHGGRVPSGFVVNGILGTHFLDLGTAVNVTKPILMKLVPGTPIIKLDVYPPGQGRASGAGPWSAGKPATVVATAARGYKFVKWMENGVTVSVAASYTFTATRNRSLVAGFTKYIPPSLIGFQAIEAGEFDMGDSLYEGYPFERPVHSVYTSAYYMEKNLVTKSLWDSVYTWAGAHGYQFAEAGSGKASNHPVHSVSWCSVVKWCNARSEMMGLTPCYTVSGSVFRSGDSDSPACNWSANGYRLPTEAEWEKAARGGWSDTRFPWGDTITHDDANYYSSGLRGCDESVTRGYHPAYKTGNKPYTSPVGSFAPNAYGLYDMAGNVWEWCWDRWSGSYYGSSPAANPTGPAFMAGNSRIRRGGSWDSDANNSITFGLTVWARQDNYPHLSSNSIGFRCVRR